MEERELFIAFIKAVHFAYGAEPLDILDEIEGTDLFDRFTEDDKESLCYLFEEELY